MIPENDFRQAVFSFFGARYGRAAKLRCQHVRPSLSGKTIPVIDPSDGQVVDKIWCGNVADIHTAATAARDCVDLVWQHIAVA